jgi:uncharacterized protein YdaU (DUF1376 family)
MCILHLSAFCASSPFRERGRPIHSLVCLITQPATKRATIRTYKNNAKNLWRIYGSVTQEFFAEQRSSWGQRRCDARGREHATREWTTKNSDGAGDEDG